MIVFLQHDANVEAIGNAVESIKALLYGTKPNDKSLDERHLASFEVEEDDI